MNEFPPSVTHHAPGGHTVSYRRARAPGPGSRRVLFFHGFPGSSAQVSLFNSVLSSADLDVVSLDRPGYGESSPAASGENQLARGIAQCKSLLDELAWREFEILTVSGGTPLGLSVAAALAERVVRTTVVCGLGPVGEPEFGRLLSPRLRTMLHLLPRLPGGVVRRLHSERGGRRLMRFFFEASPPDQEVLADALVFSTLMRAKAEAWSQGGRGPQDDARSYVSDWAARLGPIRNEVRFFHGESDRVLSIEMSRLMARRIPGARFFPVSGEGHFSLPVRQISRILL